MGNLGKYQDIVVAAKEVGGVDKLIEQIEESAVSKAAPRIFGKGALVGALLGTAMEPLTFEVADTDSGRGFLTRLVRERALSRPSCGAVGKRSLRRSLVAAAAPSLPAADPAWYGEEFRPEPAEIDWATGGDAACS